MNATLNILKICYKKLSPNYNHYHLHNVSMTISLKHNALRKKEWAKCYHANTNMYLEAFHHVVKYVYMKGKPFIDF